MEQKSGLTTQMFPDPRRPIVFKRIVRVFGGALVLLLIIPSILFSQKITRVRIENADFLRLDKRGDQTVRKLVGNVILKQDSTFFYCDSATLDDYNNLEAIGNVHITYSDSVELFGHFLHYDGNTRIAVVDSNVRLVDKKATLYTDHLIYDRFSRIARYNTGGRIIDEENVLTSITGRYYTQTHEYFFRDSVVVTNPDYIMYSDTLIYNTRTEMVRILGPTDIYGEKDHIYSEEGWYDTRKDKTQLRKNNRIDYGEQVIVADTIFYDKENGYGYARNNIWMKDTARDVIVEGDTAEFFKSLHYGYITGMTRAILIDKEDSLYLHADTFRVVTDSADEAKFIYAYHRAKFYRKDLQGMCDSMAYSIEDSLITMLGTPVLWSDDNQLTSDTILIYASGNRIDSLTLVNTAFIISRDTTDAFNQIKGREMVGYLHEGQLRRVNVNGNAETIYFVREEDGSLIGINVALSSDMSITVSEKKIKSITYFDQPDAVLHPPEELTPQETYLKGFQWIEGRRPLNRNEIFIWKD